MVQWHTWGQWKPSLAYNRLDVKDSDQNLDDTPDRVRLHRCLYNINENFDIYVDYKANLLSSEGSDGLQQVWPEHRRRRWRGILQYTSKSFPDCLLYIVDRPHCGRFLGSSRLSGEGRLDFQKKYSGP